eukprot:3491745-Lingulodinium_polyedra.AAC.1
MVLPRAAPRPIQGFSRVFAQPSSSNQSSHKTTTQQHSSSNRTAMEQRSSSHQTAAAQYSSSNRTAI